MCVCGRDVTDGGCNLWATYGGFRKLEVYRTHWKCKTPCSILVHGLEELRQLPKLRKRQLRGHVQQHRLPGLKKACITVLLVRFPSAYGLHTVGTNGMLKKYAAARLAVRRLRAGPRRACASAFVR